ncbi:MAG TPA: APC family permease [Marmoricola sp.]|nr:APC family permease [Marmoricola sp.]
MSITSAEATGAVDKGLKGGSLGLLSSIVVGVASTAPAYSLAASLGYVVITSNGEGIIGTKAPLIMILAFVPMYFIAVAYAELNKAEPDCGTTFTWAARAFGTRVGWMGGWGIIAADVIVMANLAAIAGSYTFHLFGFTTLARSPFWSTVAGVVWIVLMTYVCYRGIEVSARLQYALLGFEMVTLLAFTVIAFYRVYTEGSAGGHLMPSLDWLSPSGLSASAISSGLLIAAFIYWGWDTAVATNEEADDPATTPGRAAILSTVFLLLTYALVSVATVAFAGVGDQGHGLGNENNAGDVFAALGSDVFGGGTFGKVMLGMLAFSVLTSASASTQTTILPTARTALSMGAFKALPTSFARIHPKYLTPLDATIWMGVVSTVFYVGLTMVSSDILADTIAAVGLMIAFYYGLTGFACVWFYRKTMWSSPRNILMQGVLPLLGGISLFTAFVLAAKTYAAPDYGNFEIAGIGSVFLIGIGALLLGVVLMLIWQHFSPSYFRGETLPRRDASELVLLEAGFEGPTLRLPDSAENVVIAPDLSNLPPGHTAVDTTTGEEFTLRPKQQD